MTHADADARFLSIILTGRDDKEETYELGACDVRNTAIAANIFTNNDNITIKSNSYTRARRLGNRVPTSVVVSE